MMIVISDLSEQSAQALDLQPGVENEVTWMELAFKLTQATGNEAFTDLPRVKSVIGTLMLAGGAADGVMELADWQGMAWASGLDVVSDADRPDYLHQDEAHRWMTCLFYQYFEQPARRDDLLARELSREAAAGWGSMLSIEDLAAMSLMVDETGDQTLTYGAFKMFVSRSVREVRTIENQPALVQGVAF